MTIVALAIVASRRFLLTALKLEGVIAGGLLLLLGTAVGDVIATQRVPRLIVLFMSSLFLVLLTNGLVSRFADDMLAWGFLCMNLGLLTGAFFRQSDFPQNSSNQEAP